MLRATRTRQGAKMPRAPRCANPRRIGARGRLRGEALTAPPAPADTETRDGSSDDKQRETRRQGRQQVAGAKRDDRGGDGPASPPCIRHPAEEETAGAAHAERG